MTKFIVREGYNNIIIEMRKYKLAEDAVLQVAAAEWAIFENLLAMLTIFVGQYSLMAADILLVMCSDSLDSCKWRIKSQIGISFLGAVLAKEDILWVK